MVAGACNRWVDGRGRWGRAPARSFFFVLLLVLGTAPVFGQDSRVQVTDPYLELHTGPGRGYPVFHVVDRGEWVTLIERRTDWFLVNAGSSKQGWVTREQLARTLTEAGVPVTFRDTLLDDYLNRRLEVGFSVGQLESDPMISVSAGYGLSDNLGVEMTFAQVAGDLSSTTLVYASLQSRPFPEWRVAPFFSLGYGRFNNVPKATLVGRMETDSSLANVGVGVRYYLTRRALLRADYRRHVVFIDESNINAYNEISMGVGFFF